jgi:mRNA-degrading endonuclease YafQ of YafQ-DinJ toxin-antitoxin module
MEQLNILTCDLFDLTSKKWFRSNPKLLEKFAQFLYIKMDNATTTVGAKDKPFTLDYLKGYMHCGLSGDVSVVYSIEGKDPQVLRLYGLMSHDEIGIGQPANPRRLRNNADKWSRQKFRPMNMQQNNQPETAEDGPSDGEDPNDYYATYKPFKK